MKPTKLPQDWKPTDFDVRYAKDRGFSDAEVADIAEDFATYWLLGMGRNKTHLCWSGSGRSAWGTWVRRTQPKTKPAYKAESGMTSKRPGGQVYDSERGWIPLSEYLQ